jgi:hypothetical protein
MDASPPAAPAGPRVPPAVAGAGLIGVGLLPLTHRGPAP